MKLTIIIPAYNAENTLTYAIESALKSFKNQEILIIDDGSNDATGKICDQYAKKNECVIAVHTKNGGVSRARNLGIEKATGDYITFMDADDSIIYSGTSDLDEQMKECDMLLFSFNEKTMGGKTLYTYLFKDEYIKKAKVADAFLHNKYNFYGPWAKIYKKDIILQNNLRFNDGQKYGEDVVFVLSYLSHITKGICLSSTIFYSHYINPKGASFCTKYYDDMNMYMFSQLQAFEKVVHLSETKNQEQLCELACFLFDEVVLHYYQRLNKNDFIEKYLESYKIFKYYITASALRKFRIFKFFKNNNVIIDDISTIEKLYKYNFFKKVKYTCKKILCRII